MDTIFLYWIWFSNCRYVIFSILVYLLLLLELICLLFIESCRIAYLLRLLPLLSWITDLQVIMLSIETSIRPLLYVVGLMFLMFFHFAVAGVLIFKKNDEFYFGTLYRAMNSLFQICTLDNWGDIALKNMYGCDYYGFPTGIPEVDAMCNSPLGLGWIAAWYFLIFITLSVMVLESLFVGIIISAMELLKDSVFQEASMWKIINIRVDKYGLQHSTLVNLMEIFEALDMGKNGLLTVIAFFFFFFLFYLIFALLGKRS